MQFLALLLPGNYDSLACRHTAHARLSAGLRLRGVMRAQGAVEGAPQLCESLRSYARMSAATTRLISAARCASLSLAAFAAIACRRAPRPRPRCGKSSAGLGRPRPSRSPRRACARSATATERTSGRLFFAARRRSTRVPRSIRCPAEYDARGPSHMGRGDILMSYTAAHAHERGNLPADLRRALRIVEVGGLRGDRLPARPWHGRDAESRARAWTPAALRSPRRACALSASD